MARLKKGLLGGVSGKVGNLVGGSWNGIDYVRSAPSGRKRSDSPQQAAVRERFKVLGEWLNHFTVITRIGFKPWADGMSAANACFSYNYGLALGGDAETGFTVMPEAVLLSRGKLAGPGNVQVSSPAPHSLTVAWENDEAQPNARPTDVLWYALFNPVKKEVIYKPGAASRQEATTTVNLPLNWAGEELHVYLGFFDVTALSGNAGKQLISNSVYASVVVSG